jgi:hypothetical protein
MRPVHTLIIAGLAPVLVNCSIHPLVDDVTRVTTYDVVRQIRCEAQRAVNDYGLKSNNTSAIAYEFTFTITENNNASGGVTWDILFPSGGNFDLQANVKNADRQRISARTFRIVDSFDELRKANCSREALEKNWVYPITGDIGIYEVVATFARLQRAGRPVGPVHPEASANVYSFADTLIFTTKFNGGLEPTLTLGRVANRFRVTQASANLAADRQDVHQVVLGMAAIPKTTDSTRRNSPFRTANTTGANVGVLSTTVFQMEATAKERALIELDRQRMLALQQQIPNLLIGQ